LMSEIESFYKIQVNQLPEDLSQVSFN
jgi:hypothetical protein